MKFGCLAFIFGEYHHTGSQSVDPMQHIQSLIAVLVVKDCQQSVVVIATASVHDHAGRLIDHQEFLIVTDYLDWQIEDRWLFAGGRMGE